MTPATGAMLCAVFLGLGSATAAAQATVAQSTPVSITATIEAIDQTNRVVTLKGPKGTSVDVNVPDQIEGFNSLRVGDLVTATYFEAVAVRVRKPGDPAPTTTPTTVTKRKERTPGSETRREQTISVSVEAIDAAAPSITVQGPRGRSLTLAVSDPGQIKDLKVGDTIDVTYHESLLVKVARAKK